MRFPPFPDSEGNRGWNKDVIWYATYSPDLNNIEHWWFELKKNRLDAAWDEFDNFRDCILSNVLAWRYIGECWWQK